MNNNIQIVNMPDAGSQRIIIKILRDYNYKLYTSVNSMSIRIVVKDLYHWWATDEIFEIPQKRKFNIARSNKHVHFREKKEE